MEKRIPNLINSRFVRSLNVLLFSITRSLFQVAGVLWIFAFSPALATTSCPPRPSVEMKDRTLKYTGSFKPEGLVAAQGILSFTSDGKNQIALTSGYWRNNATIFNSQDFAAVSHHNLSNKTPSGLIASVYEQNGRLWWTSYREESVFVTDDLGNIKGKVDLPDLHRPVGLTGDPKNDLIFVQSRDENKTLYVIDEVQPHVKFALNLKAMKSAPYDIDFFNDCLFLIESNEGRIWTLEVQKIRAMIKLVKENKNSFFSRFFSSYDLVPQIWFTQVTRPQHQFVRNGELFVIDTDDYSVMKIRLSTGQFQKLNLPIRQIFRGLTVTNDGEILLTGFQDIDRLQEDRTAIFRMREVE